MGQSGSSLEWVVAIATVAALLIAAWELRANAKNAGQTHAREAWMKYLELGFQNPELGSTELAAKHLKIDINDVIEGKSAEVEKYIWFLDIMLEACESLIDYFPSDSWENTIKFNIRLHKHALRHTWEGECIYYSRALCDIVQGVLDEDDAVHP